MQHYNIAFFLEYSALITGLIGTALWAVKKRPLLVAIMWLVSSLMWIVFAQMNGHVGLTIRDVVGVALCLLAIKNYFKEQ